MTFPSQFPHAALFSYALRCGGRCRVIAFDSRAAQAIAGTDVAQFDGVWLTVTDPVWLGAVRKAEGAE